MADSCSTSLIKASIERSPPEVSSCYRMCVSSVESLTALPFRLMTSHTSITKVVHQSNKSKVRDLDSTLLDQPLHVASQHLHNMPTTLFDLPRELRDEIYHYLWLGTSVILAQTEPLAQITAWYNINPFFSTKNAPRQSTKLPSWLRTGRPVMKEDIEAFHRRGLITVVPPGLGPMRRYLHISNTSNAP